MAKISLYICSLIGDFADQLQDHTDRAKLKSAIEHVHNSQVQNIIWDFALYSYIL